MEVEAAAPSPRADVDEEDEGQEEQEESQSDEEYDLKQFGIYQALPVEGEPDWSSGACFRLLVVLAW